MFLIIAWSVNLALAVVLLLSTVVLSICLRRDNKRDPIIDDGPGIATADDNKASSDCVEDAGVSRILARYDI
jgi:hypothetical protein